jgi:diguanylate cyclase (GGDEF)-like protein
MPYVSHSQRYVVLVLAAAASVAVLLLTHGMRHRAAESQHARVVLAHVERSYDLLNQMPWTATGQQGSTPEGVRKQMLSAERSINASLSSLQRTQANQDVASIQRAFSGSFAVLEKIRFMVAHGQRNSAVADWLGAVKHRNQIGRLFSAADRAYASRASHSSNQAEIGIRAAVIALLLAFGVFFLRSRWLLDRVGSEARTDALTGLPNRRALFEALEALQGDPEADRRVLVLLDLDGFKTYNDTFGHPEGDALLVRLAHRLRAQVAGRGEAYRMGGDEFCVLASLDEEAAPLEIASDAAEALSDKAISASFGFAPLGSDPEIFERALALADQRMYRHKAERAAHRSELRDGPVELPAAIERA